MAFSLEAALVVPLVISTWIGCLNIAEPVYSKVWQTARVEVLAAGFRIENQHLYQTADFQYGSARTTAVQTSPQMVLEICSLFRDDFHLVSRNYLKANDQCAGNGADNQ